jgi:hypothetical protein
MSAAYAESGVSCSVRVERPDLEGARVL